MAGCDVFLSTLSLRRATDIKLSFGGDLIFLSTLSLRRATFDRLQICLQAGISIHALLAESDAKSLPHCFAFSDFYPRSPCGERLLTPSMVVILISFLSTLSLRRATAACCISCVGRMISIHALLAESDCGASFAGAPPLTFLSTLSLRRATGDSRDSVAHKPDFYPRSPCGERRGLEILKAFQDCISIHALLAESDSALPVFLG